MKRLESLVFLGKIIQESEPFLIISQEITSFVADFLRKYRKNSSDVLYSATHMVCQTHTHCFDTLHV